ncbi:DUF3613 domain-containing protein [Achromobacter xylosoxidans]
MSRTLFLAPFSSRWPWRRPCPRPAARNRTLPDRRHERRRRGPGHPGARHGAHGRAGRGRADAGAAGGAAGADADAAGGSQAAPAEPAPEAFGDITRGLLAAQADGRRAGAALPVLGAVSTAAWNRYVNSFTRPIPEWFTKRVETENTN